MAVIHFRVRHIRLIARYYARNLIRGGMGIIFTLGALFTGLIIAYAIITPVEKFHKAAQQGEFDGGGPQGNPLGGGLQVGRDVQKKEIVDWATREICMPVAKWMIGGDEEHADFLLNRRPALVSAILMLLLFFLPFLICLGSFNQLSGDIQYKGLRYLLLRTERSNIFLGRFLGTVVFTLGVLALVLLVLFLYLAFKANYYPAGEVFLWLLQGFLALVLFALPYIALCAWISCAVDSPFVALVICELLAIFPPIFVAIASAIEPNLHVLGWLLPWPFRYTLLHPNPLYWLLAVGDMLLFTSLFVFLGLRHFQKRDL